MDTNEHELNSFVKIRVHSWSIFFASVVSVISVAKSLFVRERAVGGFGHLLDGLIDLVGGEDA